MTLSFEPSMDLILGTDGNQLGGCPESMASHFNVYRLSRIMKHVASRSHVA